MNVLGETNEKYSFTAHFVQRWKQRVDACATYDSIKKTVEIITKYGNRYPIDESHYRACFNGICVVLMQLSPLHSLAKTVYEKDETTLSAI